MSFVSGYANADLFRVFMAGLGQLYHFVGISPPQCGTPCSLSPFSSYLNNERHCHRNALPSNQFKSPIR